MAAADLRKPIVLLILFVFSITVVAWRPSLNNGTEHPQILAEPVTINYHMGPVLTPEITVHIIWYGHWPPVQKRVIREFINSLSALNIRSPSIPEWWKTVQMYTDQTDLNVSRTVLLGREKNDRLHSHGLTLTRLSVQSVIRTAITTKTNPLPVHPKGGLYLVLTDEEVVVQDFCVLICGFHYFTFASIVGHTLPFAWVGNSAKLCPGMCAFPFAVPEYMKGVEPLKSPNGDAAIDGMVSVIGHEIAELATNPLVNGWYAGDNPIFPSEVGDLCEGVYGIGGGSGYVGKVLHDKNGAVYNMVGIRRRFLVQWVWNHIESRCSGPYVG